jgi:hypothetical protein
MRNFIHPSFPTFVSAATEEYETAPRGFNRWVATGLGDYAPVEEIY